MKVVVTGAGALLGQGIIRSLDKGELNCEIIAVDPSPLSAGLYWHKKRYLVPLAKDPAFLDGIRAILCQEQPQVLIPGTDAELAVLARNRIVLEKESGCRILISNSTVVEIADDKKQTADFFRDAGFAYPQTVVQSDEEGIRALIAQQGFPLLVKPRIGARSIGVSVVASQEELDRALADGQDLIVQEYLSEEGGEFTAGAVYFDGHCHACIVMRRDLRDGNTYRAYVDQDPDRLALVRRWTEALQPHGPVNFQFRLDKAGEPTVFEINSRFSGTTPLRALVGFNEVEMALRYLCDGTPIGQPQIQPMTILRHWSETVVEPTDVEAVSSPLPC